MTTPELSPALLAAIATGDEAAFERLFRAWYPKLASYASRMLKQPDLAEDAVQEVFVALWNRRESLPDAAALGGYLHKAVRNRALNQLRGERGDKTGVDALAEVASPPDAERHLEEEELAVEVSNALQKLPPRTKEVFLLSREQQLSYAQIAATLEISVKTVETLMGRALKTLREVLAPRLRE